MITKETITNNDLLGLRVKAGRANDTRTVRAVDDWLRQGDEAALKFVLAKLNQDESNKSL